MVYNQRMHIQYELINKLWRQQMTEKTHVKEFILHAFDRCDSIWVKKIAPLRILLRLRWGKSFDVEEARQLAEYAQSNYSAQMAAGKVILYGNKSRLSVIVDAEKCFRRALELSPHSADAMAYLAHSLDCQGRWGQAKNVYERALELNPAHDLARNRYAIALETLTITEEATTAIKEKRLNFSRFPETIASLANLERAVMDNVLNRVPKGTFFLTKKTRIVTIGSCFAANLANFLIAEGIVATNLTVGEEVNSTYANLEFFQWAFGEKSLINEEMGRVNRDTTRLLLESADVIIYTLGVAPCFFDTANGKFVLPKKTDGVRGVISGKYVFRNTTVEENFDNLKSIVALIRRYNPECDFVFSLSPVPLHTTLELRSSMEADCLSKSILRVTVEQIVTTSTRCIYWPAFEIVKWLGVYVPNMYGEEDGTCGHVSERVVEMIMVLFLQFYMRTESEPADTL